MVDLPALLQDFNGDSLSFIDFSNLLLFTIKQRHYV